MISLPDELLIYSLYFLNGLDLFILASVSRSFYKTLDEDSQDLWNNYLPVQLSAKNMLLALSADSLKISRPLYFITYAENPSKTQKDNRSLSFNDKRILYRSPEQALKNTLNRTEVTGFFKICLPMKKSEIKELMSSNKLKFEARIDDKYIEDVVPLENKMQSPLPSLKKV